jgi:hypothetical protein
MRPLDGAERAQLLRAMNMIAGPPRVVCAVLGISRTMLTNALCGGKLQKARREKMMLAIAEYL